MKILLQPNPRKKTISQYKRITAVQRTESGGVIEDEVLADTLTRAPGTKFRVIAPISYELGGALDTGELLEETDNPFKDESFADPKFEKVLGGKEKAKLQHILEFKHNKPFNYYTNQIEHKIAGRYKEPMKEIPYLQRAETSLSLDDGPNFLDLNNPLQELQYYLCRADNRIANSMTEMTSQHDYYITTVEESEAIKAEQKHQVNKAVAALEALNDKDPETLVQMARVLGMDDKVPSPSKAYSFIDSYIKTKSGAKANRENFLNYYKMSKDKAKREEFNVRALLKELQLFSIITEKAGNYTWQPPKGEEGRIPQPVTWKRYDAIIQWIIDPDHAEEVQEMREQLQYKQKFN